MTTTTDSDYDEIDRISKLISDHRLDYCAAIAVVVRCIDHYDPELHAKWKPRKFLRAFAPVEFGRLHNAHAAVQAFELLKAERYVGVES